MKETPYRLSLAKRIQARWPECVIIYPDPSRQQGIMDFVVLFNSFWVALEVKRSESASKRPNQTYYVNKLNDMAFASYIHPGNEQDVLNEIQYTLDDRRSARISQR